MNTRKQNKFWKLALIGLVAGAMAFAGPLSAEEEVDDDAAKMQYKKAKEEFNRWLVKAPPKYRDFIIFAEAKPIQDLLARAWKEADDEGNYERSFAMSTLAIAKTRIAFNNARLRAYQHEIDKFYLNKFKREIDAKNKAMAQKELANALLAMDFKKAGRFYKTTIPTKNLETWNRSTRRYELTAGGKAQIVAIADVLKQAKLVYPKATVEIEYGNKYDRGNTKYSGPSSEMVQEILEEKGVKVKMKAVGRSIGSNMKITIKTS